MLKINKAVPQPKVSQGGKSTRRKYPFEDMDVGDMFFVPNKTRNTLATHVSTVGKQLNRKFSTRLVKMVNRNDQWVLPEADASDTVIGIGVWRVE